MSKKIFSSMTTRVALAVILVAGLVLSFNSYVYHQRLVNLQQTYSHQLAREMLYSLEFILQRANPEDAANLLADISERKKMLALRITYKDLGLEFDTRKSTAKDIDWANIQKSEVLHLTSKFIALNGSEGVIDIVFGGEAAKTDIAHSLNTSLLATLFLTAIFVVIVYAVIWGLVLMPLDVLKRYINNFDFFNEHQEVDELKYLPKELHSVTDTFNAIGKQLKQHIHELSQNNVRFKLAFRKFPLPLGTYDPVTGYIDYVNEQFTETFGYELEDIPSIGSWYQKAFPDEMQRKAIRESWDEQIARNRSGTFSSLAAEEHQITCKDGSKRYVLIGGIFAYEQDYVVAIFIDVSDKYEARKALLDQQSQLKELTAHVQEVREKERKRIARELHDELGQILTVARIDLSNLEEKIPEQNEELRAGIHQQIESIDRASEASRRLSENLRPGILDLLGLAAALEVHITRFCESTGIKVILDIGDLEAHELDDNTATTAFRIVQESLTNVARYAQASEVQVYVDKLVDEIILVVKDNGIGMDMSTQNYRRGFGLLGMQERAEALGGSILVESEPGKGLRIEASLPTDLKTEHND